MSEQPHRPVRFTLRGTTYDLTRSIVETRLADVVPERIQKHAVRVNGTWYPVMQAFEIVLGVPRSSFISHEARRHLVALEFEVRGEVTSRSGSAASTSETRPVVHTPSGAAREWYREVDVQAAVVASLVADGWQIVSVADTATKERGVDVVAERDSERAGIEVKGFPTRGYADPARAAETKPTSPSTQAGHWFSQAILAAMRLRGRQPAWRSVIALPKFPRYENLYAETAGSLNAADIEVWWVLADGQVIQAS